MPHPDRAVAVGPPCAGLSAQADEADHHAGDDEEAADGGRPDHHLVPKRRVLAEDGGVEPVRDGAEPVPETLMCVDVLHHLARFAVDVDPAAGRVVEGDPPERLPAAGALHGPLVDADGFDCGDAAGDGVAGGPGGGDGADAGLGHGREFIACGEREGLRAIRAGHAQDRFAAQHLDPRIAQRRVVGDWKRCAAS